MFGRKQKTQDGSRGGCLKTRKEKYMRLGALEAGGTKMVCAIGDENGKIREQVSIPTTTPEETMPKIAD